MKFIYRGQVYASSNIPAVNYPSTFIYRGQSYQGYPAIAKSIPTAVSVCPQAKLTYRGVSYLPCLNT